MGQDYTYIYALRDPVTKKVRYIGKADDVIVRLKKHIRNARRSTKPKRNAWIRGLLNTGLKPEIVILAKVPFERWAIFETQFIAHYRAAGYDLLNETDGGTGGATRGAGYKRPEQECQAIRDGLQTYWAEKEDIEEYKDRSRQLQIDRWKDPEFREMNLARQRSEETREKRRKAQLARWENPEERERQSQVGKRNWQNPEIVEKMVEGIKQSWQNPECREQRSASMKRAWEKGITRELSDGARAKMSDSSKQRWQDPEFKERVSQARRAAAANHIYTEEERAASSARSKKMWETRDRSISPETREVLVQSTKKCWDDPEYRAKQMESRRKRWEKYHKEKDGVQE